MRKVRIFLLLGVVASAVHCHSQESPGPKAPHLNAEVYFRRYVGLSETQIKTLRAGKGVAKTLHPRTPAEIFVFGAVYVNASPDAYLAFATDFDRLKAPRSREVQHTATAQRPERLRFRQRRC